MTVDQQKSLDDGAQLYENGCRQGALAIIPSFQLWLEKDPKQTSEWSPKSSSSTAANMIVASQDCDIKNPSEKWVEVIPTRWITDKTEIGNSRKGNSSRTFLIEERTDQALIADQRNKIHVLKTDLLDCQFKAVLLTEVDRSKYVSWLARRYNRPAIDNKIVQVLQKPIVTEIESLRKKSNDAFLRVIDSVDELLFKVHGEEPWKVDLIALISGDSDLSAEDKAELGGWLSDLLVKPKGAIKEISFCTVSDKISLRDYLQLIRLQLDHFSSS